MKISYFSPKVQLPMVVLCLAIIFSAWLVVLPDFALAQNSLGVGGSEQAIKPTGFFAKPLQWIYLQQQSFYNGLRKILLEMKQNGTGFWVLVGLSFTYGVFHAAGPGHGKVIISSYMLANEIAAKRGIFLSFASSLIQGMSAIVVAFLAVFILRGTGISYGDMQYGTELLSYLLVMLVGLMLLWRKLGKSLTQRFFGSAKAQHNHGHAHAHAHAHGHDAHHVHSQNHSHDHAHHHHHDHVHDGTCSCGHNHGVDPKNLEGVFSLKQGASAILAVGLRPCSGALIVLIFTLLNGLYAAGVISVLAMSIGTGITVSTLAVIASSAKNIAIKYTNQSDRFSWVFKAIEILGALLVFSMGALLFFATLLGK